MRKTHPPGTLVLPMADLARYADFTMAFACLEQPEGTKIGSIRCAGITVAVNEIIREMEGEWVWMLADDHVFDPGILMRLLDHEVDVVVPLCWKRSPPYQLVIYKEETEKDGHPAWVPFDPREVPADGLFEVAACGGAGMLIRKHVLDAIGDPWFVCTEGDVQNEDVNFCRKVREAGFEILCDPNEKLGHISQYTIWPERREGLLGWRLDLGGGQGFFQAPRPEPVPA